jgi:AraC-like DNA-binding protein
MEQQTESERKPVQSSRKDEALEAPYTVGEVAELTGLSIQTVIRIFTQERGVLIYEPKRTRKRASYRTIRIPRYVYRRVVQEWTVQK